jgi:hypothetical protein
MQKRFGNTNVRHMLRNVFFVLAVVAVLFYIGLQAIKGGDFKIYLGAAELLGQGQSCYHTWIDLGGGNFCGYSYSPLFASLLIPITSWPTPVPEFLWLLLNVVFLFRITTLISSYFDTTRLYNRQKMWWVLLSSVFALRFVLHNFEMVQMTIFLLWCALESLRLIEQDKPIRGAALLAIGINIKLLPFVLVPWLLLRCKYRALGWLVVFTAGFLFLPSLWLGLDFNADLLGQWWETINPSSPKFNGQQNAGGEGVHSLSALIPAFFSETSSTALRRHIIQLSPSAIFLVIQLARLALILLSLHFIGRWKKVQFLSKKAQFRAISYLFLITPLIFPHQQKYAFIFILPAATYVCYTLLLSTQKQFDAAKKKQRRRFTLLALSFVLTTVASGAFLGSEMGFWTQYYKTITWGALVLIWLLLLEKPEAQHAPANSSH